MFAAAATLFILVTSLAICLVKSALDVPETYMPCASMRFFTAGSFSASATAFCTRATVSAGVSSGRHQTKPRRIVQLCVACFLVGGHIGQHGQTLAPRHRNRTQLAALDVGQRRGHLVKVHRHLAAQHIVDGGACTTVGNVQHVHTRRLDELRAPHVADGAVARGGIADLAGVGLQVGHQLGKILGRNQLGVDHHDARGLDDLGHAHEVFGRVVRQLGVDRRVDAVGRQGCNTKGQAVGCTRHFGHADGATGTRLVFNHYRLAQQLGQHVLHVARHHVGRAPAGNGTMMRNGRVSWAIAMPDTETVAATATAERK